MSKGSLRGSLFVPNVICDPGLRDATWATSISGTCIVQAGLAVAARASLTVWAPF